jgi:hypothetical protein
MEEKMAKPCLPSLSRRSEAMADSILHLRPVLLAGPTATGKSEIALRVAGQFSGEIVSADSMQV